MGCSFQKNKTFNLKKSKSLEIHELDTRTQWESMKSITLQKNFEIDLPYRHYISPYMYIPSSMPHQAFQYRHKLDILVDSDINNSSLLKRRFKELKHYNKE